MDVVINNPPTTQTFQTQGMPYAYGPQGYGYKHHDGPPLGLIALLIGGFVLLKRRRCRTAGRGDVLDDVRDTFKRGRDRFVNDQALHIARERYAKGEINESEYEALKRNLSGEQKPEGQSYAKPQDSGDLKL